ncbi:MAG: hypothetical protein JXR86_03160 [Spirochaetales bacterium]|nr:hypothetical protein [Spirochaetales bacterium]
MTDDGESKLSKGKKVLTGQCFYCKAAIYNSEGFRSVPLGCDPSFMVCPDCVDSAVNEDVDLESLDES